jgi:ubiquinone/menaquinone biosynthesis C-methylase UbiE
MTVGLNADRPSAAARAFDRLAPSYDALAGGDLFRRQRARTHEVIGRRLAGGYRVLELGCGTGWDTEFLGRLGARVLACDASSAMVAMTERRVFEAGLARAVRVLHCGVETVAGYLEVLAEGRFDAIVSNFGALNCVDCLAPLGELSARWLRPGGTLILGLLGRSCAWEQAYFVWSHQLRQARRRHRPPPVLVAVAGVEVPTYYHTLAEVRRALGADLALESITGIGVLTPPMYLEPRWSRLPAGVRAAVDAADRVVCRMPPFNRLGDHILLAFRRSSPLARPATAAEPRGPGAAAEGPTGRASHGSAAAGEAAPHLHSLGESRRSLDNHG